MNSNRNAFRGPVHTLAVTARWLAVLALSLGWQFSAAQTIGSEVGKPPSQPRQPAMRPVFDHLKTGFELLGYHKQVKCEECHIKGVFKGTPKECATCHSVGSRFITATTMSANHFPVGAKPCDDCHMTSDWTSINVRHDSAMSGKCITCHNGTRAKGEPINHFPTQNASCDYCHSTVTWTKAYFNHSVMVNIANGLSTPRCDSCHNGYQAQGPGTLHIPRSGADCNSCHANPPAGSVNLDTYALAWMTNVSFDHNNPQFAATVAVCSYCHNNTLEVGKGTGTPAHMTTTQECVACHRTSNVNSHVRPDAPGFLGATMSHTGIGGGCTSCHSGSTSFQGIAGLLDHGSATGTNNLVVKMSGHVSTTLACETCHSASNFTTFSGTAMNHTGITSGCKSCHLPGPDSTVQYQTTVVGSLHNSTHIPTTQASDNCETCHTSTATGGFSSVTADKSAIHTGISAGGPCITCHESTVSFAGLANITTDPAGTGQLVVRPGPTLANGYDHPTSGDCGGCHNSFNTFAISVAGAGMPTGHFATTQACTLCHSGTTGYGVGASKMDHTGLSNCATTGCHNSSFTMTFSAASGKAPVTITPVATTTSGMTHMPYSAGTDCSNCHKAAAPTVTVNAVAPSYSPGGTFKVSTYIGNLHSYVDTGACTTCHSGSATFTGMTNVKTIAAAIGYLTVQPDTIAGCASGNGTAHGNLGECKTCHTVAKIAVPGTASTGFCNASMSLPNGHFSISSSAGCSPCHSTGYAIGATKMDHSAVSLSSCGGAGCHNGAATSVGAGTYTAVSVSSVPSHMSTTGDCVVCHSATGLPVPTVNSTVTYPVGGSFKVTAYPANLHSAVSTSSCNGCHGSAVSFTGLTNVKTIAAAVGSLTIQPDSVAGCAGGNGMAHGNLGGDCVTCHKAAYIAVPGTGTTGFCNALPANHFAVTGACTACHSSANYSVGTTVMDHSAVSLTSCAGSGCHNGAAKTIGTGTYTAVSTATVIHIPVLSTSDCINCHTTSGIPTKTVNVTATYAAGGGFKVASYVSNLHNYVNPGDCTACHDNQTFTGMTPTTGTGVPVGPSQIASYPTTVAAPCTSNVGFVHGAMGTCSNCHSSMTIPSGAKTGFCSGSMGLPANHVPSSSTCTACHSGGYAVGKTVMDHTQATGTCVSCHALGAGNSYFNTVALGTTAVGSPHIPLTNTNCAACHGAAPSPMTIKSTTGSQTAPGFKLTINNSTSSTLHSAIGGAAAVCSTCHFVGSSYFGVTMVSQPANHIPNPGGVACSVCHTNATSSNYAVGVNAWRLTNPMQMVHTGIVSNCAACHGVGHSFTMNGITLITMASGGAMGSLPCGNTGPHMTITGDCSGCHPSTTIPSSGAQPNGVGFCKGQGFPANHIPLSGSQQAACATNCHAAGYTTGTTKMNHAGGLACTTCHSTGAAMAFAGTTPVGATTPGTHLPLNNASYGTAGVSACSACHVAPTGNIAITGSGSTFVSLSGSRIYHTGTGIAPSGKCQGCHEKTATSPVYVAPVGGESYTKINYPHQGASANQSCDSCKSHTTNGFP